MPAIAAVLVAALLPNGFLPRAAGPCGRELCNCPFATVQEFAHCVCLVDRTKAAKPATRWFDTSVNPAEEPGSALQFVFGGLLVAQGTERLSPPIDHETIDSAASRQFHLALYSGEITSPPPRA